MLVVVVVALLAALLSYRRQVVSYLTHWEGSPTSTEPYVYVDGPIRFHLAVAGDVGDSGSRIDATGAAVAEIGRTLPYDALLLLGDNVYPSGDPTKLPGTVFEPFGATLAAGAELLAILGNHDVRDGNGPAQLAALGMEGPYWARTYGDVLLVGIDSNDIGDSAQLAFLTETLEASDATWKIVALHHPPYSAGYQGSSTDVRDVVAPIFERTGVQLVLSGHDHDYQRSVPIGGVTYVVTGGAAGTRRTGTDDFTAVSWSWHHFVDIVVGPDRLILRAVNQNGRVADELVLPEA
jgi:3',5'-cyclic AMP phosphodiesterase CpdA